MLRDLRRFARRLVLLVVGASSPASDVGLPADVEPTIDWATPRVPIGAPTVEIQGGRFDPAGLTVEIDSGSTKIQAQIVSNAAGTLIVKPTWPSTGSTVGSATIVATNSNGASSPKAITLVQPGFGPAKAAQATLSISMPGWVQIGQITCNSGTAGTSALSFRAGRHRRS